MVAAHADVRRLAGDALTAPVLKVSDLKTEFDTPDGIVHAVNGVSFEIQPGEFLGVVGESGSGKSVTMMSLLKLIPMPPGRIVSGSAHFDGDDLLTMDASALRAVRGGKIGFIFQDPMTSLNPVLTIGDQLTEPLSCTCGATRRRPTRPPAICSPWSVCPTPSSGSSRTRTSSRAACASAS